MFLEKRFWKKEISRCHKKSGCKIETDFNWNIIIKKIRKILNTKEAKGIEINE
jgi:hypothetical protein